MYTSDILRSGFMRAQCHQVEMQDEPKEQRQLTADCQVRGVTLPKLNSSHN